jgi:hypothetical protein
MLVAVGCSRTEQAVETDVETSAEQVADVAIHSEDFEPEVRHDVVYVCNCGPDCTCGAVSTEAGPCSCGTELTAGRVIKVEDTDAILCACEGDCSCQVSVDDESTCSCGTDVRRVSLEGSGLYYCNCGGSCTCNHVSAEPGTCSCGMELVTG